jgi:hypothetical protein
VAAAVPTLGRAAIDVAHRRSCLEMKTCHHCDAEFESGLTCPACHGFVPDPLPPDDLWDGALPTVSLGGWIETGDAGAPLPPELEGRKSLPREPERPMGAMGRATLGGGGSMHDAFGAVLGPDDAPSDSASSSGDLAPGDGSLLRDGDHDHEASPSPGPSWAASSAALVDGEDTALPAPVAPEVPVASATRSVPADPPAAAPTRPRSRPGPPIETIASTPTDRAAPPSRRAATPPVAPAVAAPGKDDLLPAAYPSWAKAAADSAPSPTPPSAPPTAQWLPPADPPAAPTGDWAMPATWNPAAPGVPAGGASPFPYAGPNLSGPGLTKPASFTLTPTTLAFGLGALLVVVLLGALILRPSSSSAPNQVAADIAGSCFTYNADHSKLDHAVPCEQAHDGEVLAFATDLTRCPDGTDAVLTTETDGVGKNGVLCIRETR